MPAAQGHITNWTFVPKGARQTVDEPSEKCSDYHPYGKVLKEYVNSGGPERYLTTQHERDQETGLDYRGARYYDSDVARFLSLDPLALDYASWSAYNYVLGNPISLIDSDGRSPECGCPDPPCDQVGSGMPSKQSLGQLGTATGVTDGTPPTHAAAQMTSGIPITVPPTVGGPISLPLPGLGRSLGVIMTLVDLLSQPIPSENLERLKKVEEKTSLERTIRNQTKHLENHRQKLEAYRQDPDGNDPQGKLKNISPDVRKSIINSTIKNWENEIRAAEKNIREATEKLKNLE